MKTYNQQNFFKHTFCEFKEIKDFDIPENAHFKSKSKSMYFYTKEGVYRKSNHWGRVANCRWKIIANTTYKNQDLIIGFAQWSDFYPINSTGKIFSIVVNYADKTAKLQPKIRNDSPLLFTFNEAQTRIKQIAILFKETKWAKHFEEDIETTRFKIITAFISTNKTLPQIKREINIS